MYGITLKPNTLRYYPHPQPKVPCIRINAMAEIEQSARSLSKADSIVGI